MVDRVSSEALKTCGARFKQKQEESNVSEIRVVAILTGMDDCQLRRVGVIKAARAKGWVTWVRSFSFQLRGRDFLIGQCISKSRDIRCFRSRVLTGSMPIS